MVVEIIETLPEHLVSIAANMRSADRDEAYAMMGLPAERALGISVAWSIDMHTGMADSEAVCIFGLGHASIISETARPWLVGTNAITRHQFAFLRRNRDVVQEWSSRYYLLENWVDVRHEESIRWLRWLGFSIMERENRGPFKMPFHRFEMRRAA